MSLTALDTLEKISVKFKALSEELNVDLWDITLQPLSNKLLVVNVKGEAYKMFFDVEDFLRWVEEV